MLETAHQPPAGAGNLDGIEGKPLFLCHFDGNRLEIAHELMTAEGSAANAQSAEHLGFVAHADLPKLNPCAEHAGEILDKVAEIHTSLGGEVEDDLAVVKCTFHIQQIHFQPVRLNLLIAYVKGLFRLDFVFVDSRKVRVGRLADDGLDLAVEFAVEFAVVNFAAIHDDFAAFCASNRLDNDVTAELQFFVVWAEVVNLAALLESYSNDLRHYFSVFLRC